MASITKLMTVLVALEHAAPRLVTVDAAAPPQSASPRSPARRRAADRARPRHRRARPERQRRRLRARGRVGGGSVERFVALMNAKAAALGLRDTHFVRPDGLDAAGHVSSARDLTRLARVAMTIPLIRDTVRRATATIAGGRDALTWNDLLDDVPGHVRRQDRPYGARRAGREVAAARRRRRHVYATHPRRPEPRAANDDLEALLAWGLARYRAGRAVHRRGRELRDAPATATAGRRSTLVAPRSRSASSASTGRSSSASSRRPRSRCRSRAGQRLGEVQRLRTAEARSPARRSSPRAPSPSPASVGKIALVRGPHASTTLVGPLGRRRDRHRHAQRCARPHADRAELPARPPASRERGAHARGRQGHQRGPRAEAARRSRRRDRPRRRAAPAPGSSRS